MTTLDKTPLVEANYYYRNDGEIIAAQIPDLLLKCNNIFKPICSRDVLFFTKNSHGSRVYCTNNISFDLDISIIELSLKLSHFRIFKHIKKNLIVNLNQVSSYRQNGQKYIFLKNGEEILLDSYPLSELLESMYAA